MDKRTSRNWMAWWIAGALVASCTGCQLDVGGQTLPSPWWYTDDVQYFPPGTEFKLSREAAALQAARQNAAQTGQAPAPAALGVGAAPAPAPGPVAPLPGGAAVPIAPGGAAPAAAPPAGG